MYSQYLRLNLHVSATNTAIIRKARKMLSLQGKGRDMRNWRHAWLREMISHHNEAKAEFKSLRFI